MLGSSASMKLLPFFLSSGLLSTAWTDQQAARLSAHDGPPLGNFIIFLGGVCVVQCFLK